MIDLLLDAALRASIVVFCIAAILSVCRVKTSGLRHAAWTTALVAMLLMPILREIVPTIPLPPSATWAAFAVRFPDIKADESTVDPVPIRPPSSRATTGGVATRRANGTVVSREQPERGIGRAVNWSAIARAVYLGGAMFLMAQFAIGWTMARRTMRRWMNVEIPGQPRVFESQGAAVPFTVGIFTPRIVLPASWRDWPAYTLSSVLAHERAHIRRRDPLVASLAHLNRCVFWFHPLAWWLERTLAVDAEHACDDEAVREVGQPRRYAEMLVDMAEAVRQSGGRVSWQGIGVGGSGLVGARIDRVLRGDRSERLSRGRGGAVLAACFGAVVLAVACRERPAELKPDPAFEQREAERNAEKALRESVRSMTGDQVTALEDAWKKNPEDLASLKKLLIYYEPDVSGKKVPDAERIIVARRPLILWLIEHHPEHELARALEARIFATPRDWLPDPAGYEAAKKLWLGAADRPGVSAQVLGNAAWFLDVTDKPLAERLLLRAHGMDPKGPWMDRLGSLYGQVLVGSNGFTLFNVVRSFDAADAHGAFAQTVRRTLDESSDAGLLTAVGRYLTQNVSRVRLDFDPAVLGKSYLSRALELDPQRLDARRLLYWADYRDRHNRTNEALRLKQAELAGADIAAKVRARERLTPDETEKLSSFDVEAVSSLPEDERLPELADLAERAYWAGDRLAYTVKDEAGARSSYERSKRAAQDALTLASKHPQHPAHGPTVYRATILLGTHALREGDRATAVRYMLEASHVQASEPFTLGMVNSLEGRLVNYLIKGGERGSVAEFYERTAGLFASEKERRLKDAAAIRAGVMPLSYHYVVGRNQ